MRRLLRIAGMLISAAGVALVAGFAWFVAASDRTDPAPPHADGIVALTGGPDRVETALRLLAAGQADQLLVSGVAQGAGLAELARRAGLDPAQLAARTTLGHLATSTVGNADEAAEWVRAHGLRSVTVVTAGYHMDRALLELGRTLPGVTLFPMRVQPSGLTTPAATRLLVGEYLKLLGALAGISRLVPQRTRVAANDPVDETVHVSPPLLPRHTSLTPQGASIMGVSTAMQA